MGFSIQDFIKIGMIRHVNELNAPLLGGKYLNLGADNKKIDGTVELGLPEWDADEHAIPFKDEHFCAIYAYHFLEHVKSPLKVLIECQRVLRKGGILNIVVPYYKSALFYKDIEHITPFTEKTFPEIFRSNRYYSKNIGDHVWKFDINFNLIIGVEEENMALYVQLIKT